MRERNLISRATMLYYFKSPTFKKKITSHIKETRVSHSEGKKSIEIVYEGTYWTKFLNWQL